MKRSLLLFGILTCLGLSQASGQIWQSVGSGLRYKPVAVTSIDKALIVAYELSNDGAKGVSFGIGIWDGTVWRHLPQFSCDEGSEINALQYYKDELYIAGKFNALETRTKSVTLNRTNHLVKWDGQKYASVLSFNNGATKIGSYIKSLHVYEGLLVVCGSFANTRLTGADNVSFFDGDNWKASPIKELSDVNGPVFTAFADGDDFYIGGDFESIGKVRSPYVAKFTKGELIKFSNSNYAHVYKFVKFKDRIIAMGAQLTGVSPTYFFDVKDSTTNLLIGNISKNEGVKDIISLSNGIYACGSFRLGSNSDKYALIRLDGNQWDKMNVGQLNDPTHFIFHNNSLHLFGGFESFRNIELNHVARIETAINRGAVTGRIYHDKNDNCQFDFRDENLDDFLLRITPGNQMVKPRADGRYFVFLEDGEYTITVLPGKYWKASTCGALSQKVTVKTREVTEDIHFPLLQQSGIKDLSVNLSSTSGPLAKRNNKQQYYIDYKNLGSSELVHGTVTLKFDQRLSNLIAKPAPISVMGDSATWRIKDLSPGETGAINCIFDLEDTASDNIELLATIEQSAQEEDDENNESSLTQVIMDEDVDIHKFVNPGTTWSDTAYIYPDAQKIDYQITFANYTNDTVRSVYVIDTVELNSTITSYDFIATSHPVDEIIFAGPKYSDYGIIIYHFKDINLPPNPTKNGEIVNDEGHVIFRMNLTNNLPVGQEYFNRAKVVFDYDFDKLTNEVSTIVEENSSVHNLTNQVHTAYAYPNPTTGSVTLDIPQGRYTYSVTNALGVTVLEGRLNNEQKVDLYEQTPGLYFVTIDGEGQQFTSKVLKY